MLNKILLSLALVVFTFLGAANAKQDPSPQGKKVIFLAENHDLTPSWKKINSDDDTDEDDAEDEQNHSDHDQSTSITDPNTEPEDFGKDLDPNSDPQ